MRTSFRFGLTYGTLSLPLGKKKREGTFKTNPGHAVLALKQAAGFKSLLGIHFKPTSPLFCAPSRGRRGEERGGGEGEREVRWEGYWFILCLLD